MSLMWGLGDRKILFELRRSARRCDLCRVRRATDALARSSATLGQIALDSGFADQSHFTRVFSAVYGLTPRRWRALHNT